MANLLAKFRLDYSSLQMVQIIDKPKPKTIEFFNTLIEDFKAKDDTDVGTFAFIQTKFKEISYGQALLSLTFPNHF